MAKKPTPSAASGDEDRRLDQIGEAFRRSASLDLENEAPDDWKAYLTIVQSRIKAQSPGYGTLSGRSLADHILPTLRALAVVYAAYTAPVPFSAFLAEELAGRSSTWRLEEEDPDSVLEQIETMKPRQAEYFYRNYRKGHLNKRWNLYVTDEMDKPTEADYEF